MNQKNIFISCVAFVVTGAVGFGVTKLVGSFSESGNITHADVVESSDSDTVIIPPNIDTVPPITEEDVANSKSVEVTKAKPITAAQLTSIINGNSNDFPRSIDIHIVGNKANEQASSIAMIRQYKNMGTWSKITVTNVEYDEANRVRAITVSVVSNGSDSEE